MLSKGSKDSLGRVVFRRPETRRALGWVLGQAPGWALG